MSKKATMEDKPVRIKVAPNGRIVIPSKFRKALGVENGGELLLRKGEMGLELYTVAQAVDALQKYFRQFKKPGESMVDEFLAERKREVERES